MEKVAIVGVGLIGASFGLALRKAGFDGPIIGVSSAAALETGLQVGAISHTASLLEAVEQSDLIYLSQPVDRIIDTLAKIGPLAKPGALITDAGSTKVAIMQAAAEHVKYATFLGGHPMAGKESRGAAAAQADLFVGRPYVLDKVDGVQADEFKDWIRKIGAQIVEMSASQHDATVALTSHLPQLISTALAGYLANHSETAIDQVFGSGLLDMTRLALSPADLWFSIINTNQRNVSQAVDGYIEALIRLKESIGTDDFRTFFASSSLQASTYRKNPR
jgi:prephenate dehydrogenase